MAHEIEFTEEAIADLGRLSARERATLLDAIEEQLVHQPTRETRNRKPMRPNPIAPWELRVGQLRVYYEVNEDPTVVTVRRIGVKDRSRVRIGDEWWEPETGKGGSHEDPGDDPGHG